MSRIALHISLVLWLPLVGCASGVLPGGDQDAGVDAATVDLSQTDGQLDTQAPPDAGSFVDGLVDAPADAPPPDMTTDLDPTLSLLISEVMVDPDAVSDSKGEWFEIYNAGATPVGLDGYKIRDNFQTHTITGAGLTVQPGQYVVLARTADADVVADYVYGVGNSTDVALANGGDVLEILSPTDVPLCTVTYSSSWPFAAGQAMGLIQPTLDVAEATSWCAETSTISGSTDKGTPGGPPSCP